MKDSFFPAWFRWGLGGIVVCYATLFLGLLARAAQWHTPARALGVVAAAAFLVAIVALFGPGARCLLRLGFNRLTTLVRSHPPTE